MNLPQDKYVYSGKAAALLEVSNKTLIKWVKQGHINCLRQGKNRKFSLAEIEKFKQSSFYRSRNPKFTLIYVRAENSLERRNLVEKARDYCQRNSWTEIAISESTQPQNCLNTLYFQQAFNYFFERKIERLICCKNQDEVSRFFSTLVKHRGIEVLDLLNL
ncbi:hypothetical protein Sta7437_4568 (plasmid) [Stanieria cyanosphaera PCC 7437]|uniref:Helix-turn-helix domain-containing protein n=1 Tax=Stanieria cyanosphaera (strain ATCC 29371 / PCC 7437) TaxID=111780 RepID=K9Y212_STAC7|nr:helix-turn-helix domain-containing protein [Stanieria cyanosphaera]AFZ38027.1 hypothetical protein Sta7437_4568 [Stanieria cyanosphaera PCC 7437]